MFSNEQLAKILLARKIIADQNALAEITTKAGTEKEALEKYVIDNKIVSEQTLYEGAADYFKIPFVNLKKQIIRQDILTLLPETTAQEHKIIAFDKDEEKIKVATLDPANLEIL